MCKKYFYLLLIFFCCTPVITKAQLPDSVKNYIDTAITILKQNSLYAARVNWPVVEKQVYEKAATATTKAQTFEALKIAFTALGDKHAAYYQYDDVFRLTDTVLDKRYGDSIKAAWKAGPILKERMIGQMAYINVPYMGVNNQKDIDIYANWLYDAIVKLAANNPKGWIIDLRLNGGGNIRPMMAGLAMFFANDTVGYYIDRNGIATDEATFLNGDFLINGVVQVTIKDKAPSFFHPKVAVLTGPGTASSGEGVAAIFKQRKNTGLFGEETAGRANSTNGFVFNEEKSYFLISTAFIGDKNKKALPEFVTPHIVVKVNNAFSNPEADVLVSTAIAWLSK